jgi:hypothetical protein
VQSLTSRRALAALLACLLSSLAYGQRPLPEADAFFKATRDNLLRATREQYRYAYKERRTELHTNPFGRMGTDGVLLYAVTPGPAPTVYFRRLLERDGKPVTNSKAERQQRRIRTGRSPMEEVVDTLRFTVDRRERANGRDLIVVRFEPRAEARPETREGRMARVFKGEIWVGEAAHEVVRLEATAIDNLSYGMGFVARLNEGTTVSLTRQPVEGGIWLPTSIRFKGNGRALLIRKLNIDFVIEWFDYEIPNPKSQTPNPNRESGSASGSK